MMIVMMMMMIIMVVVMIGGNDDDDGGGGSGDNDSDYGNKTSTAKPYLQVVENIPFSFDTFFNSELHLFSLLFIE